MGSLGRERDTEREREREREREAFEEKVGCSHQLYLTKKCVREDNTTREKRGVGPR